MKRFHLLFSLFSFIVILVTLERFSFTTRLFLPPDRFIRLHEVIQTIPLTICAALISFLLLVFVTQKFSAIKTPMEIFLVCIFITGVYLYGAGEGSHEIASFAFNTFCPVKTFTSYFCKSMFINDYYFGNILYFLGGILMNIPLFIFERTSTKDTMTNKDITLITINAVFYAFGLFAYAAFDIVILGLIYCIISLILSAGYLFTYKKSFRQLPVTYYLLAAYAIGTIPGIIVRLGILSSNLIHR